VTDPINQLASELEDELATEAAFDGDPAPLFSTKPLPDFPVASLPEPLADMVAEVAVATQTDPAMAATSVLAVVSTCTGGHAVIEVRAGWREPLNGYFAPIAEPGERKSPVLAALTRPLIAEEQAMAKAGVAARAEAMTRKQVADAAAEQARREAARARGDDNADTAMADAIGAAAMADAITVPEVPQLLADDVTPEALGTLMAQQGGRLGILSAEGGLFDTIAGRYSGGIPNMDLILKAHAGDTARIDRKGRPAEYIPRPALTLCLMTQPAVLANIAGNRQFHGRGLLARFMYAYPISNVGYRQICAPPATETTVDNYTLTIRELASGMAGWVDDPAVLILSDTATTAMIEIETEVETALREGGDLHPIKGWGSKYVGAVARIAGMIHLATIGSDKGPRTPVTADTVLAAHRIGQYFRACAIKAFAEMGTDEVTTAAQYLLRRIASLGASQVSVRDMFNAVSRTRFKTKADMMPAVERLVEHGYLAPIPNQGSGAKGGRPKSPEYQVHPNAAKHA
jgi:hypothetical protein